MISRNFMNIKIFNYCKLKWYLRCAFLPTLEFVLSIWFAFVWFLFHSLGSLAVIPNAMHNSSLALTRMPPPILFVYGLVFRGYTNDSLCAETSRRSLLPGILHMSLLNYILNAPIERNFILFSLTPQYLVKVNRPRNNSINIISCKCDKIKGAWYLKNARH